MVGGTAMTIQLPADLEQRINTRLQVESGSTVSDVLREALDALEARDEELIAIRQGLEDLENGDVVSLEDFDREFRQRHNIPRDV
jgi:predicted transcriptional regulator